MRERGSRGREEEEKVPSGVGNSNKSLEGIKSSSPKDLESQNAKGRSSPPGLKTLQTLIN